MRQLYSQITINEWEIIVDETVKYYIFLRALKEVGMPMLGEQWTKLCEYFLVGLRVNVFRMKKIEPLLVARIDKNAIFKIYKKKMEEGAKEFMEEVRQIHEGLQQQAEYLNIRAVSDL